MAIHDHLKHKINKYLICYWCKRHLVNLCSTLVERSWIGGNQVKSLVSCEKGCSFFALFFLGTFQLAFVVGDGNSFCFSISKYLSRNHPPTGYAELLFCIVAPRIWRCSNRWHIQLWWQPYSGLIHMYGSMFSATWRKGGWLGVSLWPLPRCPASRPLRRRRGKSDKIVGYRHARTYASPTLCWEETFLQSLLDVGGGVYIHDYQADNEVRPLL